jgi:hypothetical protein
LIEPAIRARRTRARRTRAGEAATGCVAACPYGESRTSYAMADLTQRLIPFTASMSAWLVALFAALRSSLRSHLDVEAKIVALRHQLAVLQRQAPRQPRLRQGDRLLWGLLSRLEFPGFSRQGLASAIREVVDYRRVNEQGYPKWWRRKGKKKAICTRPSCCKLLERAGICSCLRRNPAIAGGL